MPGPKSKPATAPEAKSKGKSKAEVGVEVPTASKGKKRSKGLDADEGEGEGEDGGRTAGDAEVKKKAKKAKVGKDESEVGGKRVLKGKKKEAVEEVEEEAQVTEEPASKSASKTKATSEVTTKPPSSKSRPTSKSSKKTVEEAQEDVDEDDEPFGADEALAGFEAEDEDDIGSSDEEEGEGPEKGVRFDLESLPKPKKASEAPKGKGKKAAGGAQEEGSRAVYLGRIPKGFYEEQMKSYFSQFGDIEKLRLSRNKRTGASKHYAFILFSHPSVAQIVAETMDNYLLHGHLMQCKVVPEDKVHPRIWEGAGRKYRPVPVGRQDRLKHNAPKSEEQQKTISSRLRKREDLKRKRVEELGIDYDVSAVGYGKDKDEGSKGEAKEGAGKEPASKKAKKASGGVEKAKVKAEVGRKVKAGAEVEGEKVVKAVGTAAGKQDKKSKTVAGAGAGAGEPAVKKAVSKPTSGTKAKPASSGKKGKA